MSRVSFRSRRGRWVLAFFACAVITVGTLAARSRKVTVAVYNDSRETWQQATLTVGRETRNLPPLASRQDVAEAFSPLEVAAGLSLRVEGSRIVHWSAPYLVQGSTARVTLHVTEDGGVVATTEAGIFSRLRKLLE